MKSFLLCLMFLLYGKINGAIDCYSCTKCEDFESTNEYRSNCLFGSQCLKISGSSHGKSIVFRGCPWSSLFSSHKEDGCSTSTISIPGVGKITGDMCLCSEELCNGVSPMHRSIYESLIILLSSMAFVMMMH